MALKKLQTIDVKLAGDIEIDCYIKVIQVSGDKNNLITKIAATKSSNTGEFVWQKEYEFVPNMNSSNFIAQAYEHLKTLPEFAGAINC
jgi:hypothetical protein